MYITKISQVRKASHFCLTLLTMAIPSTTDAIDFNSKDSVDYPVVGGSVKVPRQKESLINTLEKKVKLLFEDYETQDDQAKIDLQSPPMDDHQQYRGSHNKRIDKYTKNNIEHSQYTSSSDAKQRAVSTSYGFLESAKKLRARYEQEDQDIRNGGRAAIKVIDYFGKEIIDSKIKHPELKKLFLEFFDKAKEELLAFINQ